MTEPDVALTDYALALECAIFTWLVRQRPERSCDLYPWRVLFFASASAAPLFGGTVHGFFLDNESVGHAVLWPLSLLAIGVTALSCWAIGARLILHTQVARWVVRAAFLQLPVYVGVVLIVNDAFWVAIAEYLPAALFLLIAFALVSRRGGPASASLGVWGLALSFVAAVLQQLRIAVHPVYFNHNALYHVVQAVALLLLYICFRGLLRSVGESHAEGK
jgi:hypothetical protein